MENTEQPKIHRRRPRGPRKPKTNTIATDTKTPLTSIPLLAPANAPQQLQPSDPTANISAATATLPRRRQPHKRANRNKTNTSDRAETAPTTVAIESEAALKPPSTPPTTPTQTKTTSTVISSMPPIPGPPQLSKEQVLAEREAKRVAKLAAKHKIVDAGRNMDGDKAAPVVAVAVPTDVAPSAASAGDEKSREAVIAEREAKKLAKLAAKNKNKPGPTESVAIAPAAAPVSVAAVATTSPAISADPSTSDANGHQLTVQLDQLHIVHDAAARPTTDVKPALSKAERRAKQEAQRAAKAAAQTAVKQTADVAKPIANAKAAAAPGLRSPATVTKKSSSTAAAAAAAASTSSLHRVKLFNHLYPSDRTDAAGDVDLHAAVIKLGVQYENRVVVGSNARCIAFLSTMKTVINDYTTPAQKEFTRGLESAIQQSVHYLHQCRPLSVSVQNALKHIKWQITQLRDNAAAAVSASAAPDVSEAEQRVHLLDSVDTYLRDQVEKAAQAISISVQQKISNGDVILTFGCSSLVSHLLQEAQKRQVDFRVVVVDARPDHEGQEMLRRLVALGVRCTCVLVNAIGFIMPVVTKVLLGAHALLANGYVMSRAGTAQVALMARAHNVPVLVCCETHKFSERVQTDAFVYNEIGRPDDLVLRPAVQSTRLGAASVASALANWRQLPHLTPLNLCYDITPPELVTAVVTELAILPCTSVPVILRMQPA